MGRRRIDSYDLWLVGLAMLLSQAGCAGTGGGVGSWRATIGEQASRLTSWRGQPSATGDQKATLADSTAPSTLDSTANEIPWGGSSGKSDRLTRYFPMLSRGGSAAAKSATAPSADRDLWADATRARLQAQSARNGEQKNGIGGGERWDDGSPVLPVALEVSPEGVQARPRPRVSSVPPVRPVSPRLPAAGVPEWARPVAEPGVVPASAIMVLPTASTPTVTLPEPLEPAGSPGDVATTVAEIREEPTPASLTDATSPEPVVADPATDDPAPTTPAEEPAAPAAQAAAQDAAPSAAPASATPQAVAKVAPIASPQAPSKTVPAAGKAKAAPAAASPQAPSKVAPAVAPSGQAGAPVKAPVAPSKTLPGVHALGGWKSHCKLRQKLAKCPLKKKLVCLFHHDHHPACPSAPVSATAQAPLPAPPVAPSKQGPPPAAAPALSTQPRPLTTTAQAPPLPPLTTVARLPVSDLFPVSYYANQADWDRAHPAGLTALAAATNPGAAPVPASMEPAPKRRPSVLTRLVARFQGSETGHPSDCACTCHKGDSPARATSIAAETGDIAKRGERVERVSAQRVDEPTQR